MGLKNSCLKACDRQTIKLKHRVQEVCCPIGLIVSLEAYFSGGKKKLKMIKAWILLN